MMRALVSLQMASGPETRATRAYVWRISRVATDVRCEGAAMAEVRPASIARVRFLFRMNAHVCLEVARFTES